MSIHTSGVAAAVASALVAAGLALTTFTSTATAATPLPGPGSSQGSPPPRAPSAAPRLSASRLAQVRDRQRRISAEHTPAPKFGAASSARVQRLTVTTTDDSGLADPTGTRCLDAATGACSLRAAVQTANNRAVPVRIVLAKATYSLSSGTELLVTNPAGTSIVGVGSARSVVEGAGSRVFHETTNGPGTAGPMLYLTDLTVTAGSTPGSGGGVWVEEGNSGGTLVLDGVAISGNSAGSSSGGGGIATQENAHLYAQDTTIIGNVARSGGGLSTTWSDVDLTDVDITGNHSPASSAGDGGGWDNSYGVVAMHGGSISGNVAGDDSHYGDGGGLEDRFGSVTLSGVHVDHNTSHSADIDGRGAGIDAESDQLDVTGGTISHNHALAGPTASGGGLALYEAQASLHHVTMAGDTVDPSVSAGSGGGAIYVYANGNITQLTIDRGSSIAGANAGAVYAYALGGHADVEIDSSRLTGNAEASGNGAGDAGCGGAVCALVDGYSALNLTMSGNTVAANTSTGDGGSGGVTVWVTGESLARVHLLHSLFHLDSTGADGFGGAVGVHTDINGSRASIRSQSNTFVANQAGTPSTTGRGGAIGLESVTMFFDRSSTFAKNRSRGPESWGGAVYSEGFEASRFTGSAFTANSASASRIGHGGAVYSNDAGATFTNVTMNRNRSGEYGGGIDTSFDNARVSLVGSTLSNNVAGNGTTSGAGGGIYVGDGVLSIESSTVTGNRAAQSDNPGDPAAGGGILVADGSLGLRYSTVAGNVAPQGGGLYSSASGGAFLGSIVSANHTATGGESDCSYAVPVDRANSVGGSVLGRAGCVAGVQGTDRVTRHPRLSALADNGGPTKTLALARTSPAIGRGVLCPATDQRGRHRPPSHCDAGAFELP
ncbi:MAG TPA: choice-of-anchor Q domain-containing protein [Nocardioides sp.]|jgi:hypothetical protein|uniref:choice-of-anchor Q domain-containing protein n=1 Tax=Nocardioides sp. TaxID=35761 RepID=UPI002E37E453|nr:choice-of-anchor Q domain-containing protein [Nocardioides sp.]HEX3932128.1 choice-of-anchor Q domain-containing protein [Nocardioides sp.]